MRKSHAVIHLLFALLISACSGSSLPGGSPVPGEATTSTATETLAPPLPELTLCTAHEPESLLDYSDSTVAALQPALFPQAAVFGEDYLAETMLLRELPSEAEGTLRRNPDGTISVILRYREGLVWSDGEPFQTSDALLGLRVPPSQYGPAVEVLDAQEGDALTVFLTLAGDSEYPYIPSQPPLPSHVMGDVDEDTLLASPYARQMTPTLGPYTAGEWNAGSQLSLEANPNYAGEPVAFSRIIVRFIADSAQIVAELQSGGCDAALDEFADLNTLTSVASAGLHLYTSPAAISDHLALNTYPPPFGRPPYFADARVRQAVAHAINRAALAQTAWGSYAVPMDSWLPPDHWAYTSSDLTLYVQDTSAASSLLDQAGWRDLDGDGVREYHGEGGEYPCGRGAWSVEPETPLAVTLVASNDPLHTRLASQIQSDLAQIGIGVQVQALDPAAAFTPDGPIVRRDFDLALIPSAIRPDPGGINLWLGEDVYLHPLDRVPVHRWQLEDRWLTSEQLVEWLAPSNVPSARNDYRGQNYSGWCNEEADIAIVQANRALDILTRRTHYARQQAIFTADVPAIPLFFRPRAAASASSVCGIRLGPYDPITWNIAAWWIDASGACGE